jgi:hypothetical protein
LAGVDSTPDSRAQLENPENRLDSWKEIAVYLGREVRTVQRWEKREGLPVHRHLHRKIGSIYAFKQEIDNWRKSRSLCPVQPVSQNGMTKLVAGAPPVFSERSGSKELTPLLRIDRKLSWTWENAETIPAIIYFRPDRAAFPLQSHTEQPECLALIGMPSRRERPLNFSAKRMATAKP